MKSLDFSQISNLKTLLKSHENANDYADGMGWNSSAEEF